MGKFKNLTKGETRQMSHNVTKLFYSNFKNTNKIVLYLKRMLNNIKFLSILICT